MAMDVYEQKIIPTLSTSMIVSPKLSEAKGSSGREDSGGVDTEVPLCTAST